MSVELNRKIGILDLVTNSYLSLKQETPVDRYRSLEKLTVLTPSRPL